MRTIRGQVVDLVQRRVFPGAVHIRDGRIHAVEPDASAPASPVLSPGLVDAHVHVESSMLPPSEFARAAVTHGTVATVSDPHEIGNVLGAAGVQYMLQDASRTPFHFAFGAPSCVPATEFETAGARIDADQVGQLLDDPRIGYLSEVMNVPGVIRGDAQVRAKIEHARRQGKPVDGHAPGLRGDDCRRYFAAGISTDHECVALDEALEKLALGVQVLIREGSAARNYGALAPLLREHSSRCMLCTDDMHPDALLAGHVAQLAARAVADGCHPLDVLAAAALHPVRHYGLPAGLLQAGDSADLVELEDLRQFRVLRTWLRGEVAAENGRPCWDWQPPAVVNYFVASTLHAEQLRVAARSPTIRVIVAHDGELITSEAQLPARVVDGSAVANPDADVAKLVVVNRYAAAPPAVAFLRGSGLRRGAIASSVAHDCHNVIALGVDDDCIAAAVNLVMRHQGGLSLADSQRTLVLPLPIAGLMSDRPYDEVAGRYSALDRAAKQCGSTLAAPFMTLSFMALLVIPDLKLSDRGLFDGRRFEHVPLFV